MKAKMSDIAKKAGVSIAAVSLVKRQERKFLKLSKKVTMYHYDKKEKVLE